MKMRKRIAALLAVAMIATVMPMTAFAASTNRVTKTVTAKKDSNLDSATAPNLVVELKDSLATDQAFYLELENAEWLEEGTGDGKVEWSTVREKVTLRRVNATTLQVNSKSTGKDDLEIPMLVKLKGGEATVTIDPNDTVVTAGKYVFATSTDTKAKIKVGDVSTFADNGTLAKLTIEESYIGAFKNTKVVDYVAVTQDVEIELNDKNFTFGRDGELNGDLKVTKGFSISNNKKGTVSDKGQKITFEINPGDFSATQRGAIEISGINVQANNKASEGDVEVYVNGYFFEDETLVVARYGDYTTSLKTEEVKEFTAGRKETVKFTLEEVAEGAINTNRMTTFTFSEDVEILKVKKAGDVASAKIKPDADDKNIFTVENFVDGSKNSVIKDKKVEIEVEINIPAKFEGDLVVTAEGRSLEAAKEVKLAEVTAPVKVTIDPMKIAVGTKDNTGGKITITETDKKMINRGLLVIQLADDFTDITFTNVKDLDLKTTGGIKVEDAKYNKDKSAITIEVTRQSTEAGSIEISGFEVTSRRTIADGIYEIEIGGEAISQIANLDNADKTASGDKLDDSKYNNIDAIVEVDFLLVGDKATKSVIQFVIGSDKFLVDGKEITMDAAAYIKDGRTMVPLRYLSYAIGIDEQAIKFNAGIVTIIDGTKIIQLQNGSKNLLVNGMTIPMSAAAEIVGTRTYVPVAEIGAVFGVTGSWDPATQTATFK